MPKSRGASNSSFPDDILSRTQSSDTPPKTSSETTWSGRRVTRESSPFHGRAADSLNQPNGRSTFTETRRLVTSTQPRVSTSKLFWLNQGTDGTQVHDNASDSVSIARLLFQRGEMTQRELVVIQPLETVGPETTREDLCEQMAKTFNVSKDALLEATARCGNDRTLIAEKIGNRLVSDLEDQRKDVLAKLRDLGPDASRESLLATIPDSIFKTRLAGSGRELPQQSMQEKTIARYLNKVLRMSKSVTNEALDRYCDKRQPGATNCNVLDDDGLRPMKQGLATTRLPSLTTSTSALQRTDLGENPAGIARSPQHIATESSVNVRHIETPLKDSELAVLCRTIRLYSASMSVGKGTDPRLPEGTLEQRVGGCESRTLAVGELLRALQEIHGEASSWPTNERHEIWKLLDDFLIR